MTLDDFVPDEKAEDAQSMIVYSPGTARPLQQMLDEPFIEDPTIVKEDDLPEKPGDGVLLVDGDGVVATNTISEVVAWIMQANVDTYTASRGKLEQLDFPDVVAESREVPFRLTGYPEANRQKQILTAVSRYIELRALAEGEGTLRTAFQKLSRIEDEYGTRSVYSRLAGSDIDTHIYGVPNWKPENRADIVTHGGYGDDFRKSWFVLYTPPEGEDGHVGLLAREVSPGRWHGFWTEDADRVEAVEEYIAFNL